MNRSRRKPTSCSSVLGSSPSGSAHCTTLLHFPLSFPSLPFPSSSFFFPFLIPFRFLFSPCLCFFFLSYSGFLSSLPMHTLPSSYAFSFPHFLLSLSYLSFSLFFYFIHRTSFPTQIGVGSNGGDTCPHVSPPHSFPHT